MKFVSIWMIAALGLFSFLHGDEEMVQAYIEPSQIAFVDRKIFAYIEGDWIPVESICVDANGLCARYKNPYHGRWRCPRCGYSNDPWQNFCQNYLPGGQCLTPRPQ